MKKINFLVKLFDEGKLQLVNPSEEIKDLYIKKSESIFFAKKERVDKQYYTDFYITKEDVLEAVKIAEDFNKRLLDFISRLNNQKIKEYR